METMGLLPDMLQSALKPLKDALNRQPKWISLAAACAVAARLAELVHSEESKTLEDVFDRQGNREMLEESRRVSEEAVRVLTRACEMAQRLCPPESDREGILASMKDSLERATKVNEYYRTMLSWLERARKQPATVPDAAEGDSTNYVKYEDWKRRWRERKTS